MPREKYLVPEPFTIPRVPIEAARGKRQRLETTAGAPMGKKKRTKGIARYSVKASWILDQLDVPRTTQHTPRLPSVILLTYCATCRDYMLEGSYAARHCVTCGAPHPLPPGLPL